VKLTEPQEMMIVGEVDVDVLVIVLLDVGVELVALESVGRK
jgi:hypothetical protein